jgi:hypothetical protein
MTRNRWLGTAMAGVLAMAGGATLAWVPGVEASASASMGPPMICHPIEIGEAKSLPFGTDAFEADKKYDAKHVIGDTLKLLKTEESALVRMETLRRATVYVRGNSGAASELLGKLAWKALDAEAQHDQKASGDRRAAAWFDAGYFAACLAQMNIDVDWKPGFADGVNGYAWIKRALEIRDDPEMQFGAALATHPGVRDSKRDLFELHVRGAAGGMESDPLLAKNVRAHLANWNESIDRIVARGK